MYFRALDAFRAAFGHPPNAAQVDEWLVQINPNATQPCFALRGQESTATFLASNGTTTIDPDTVTDPPYPSPFFETPFTGQLP